MPFQTLEEKKDVFREKFGVDIKRVTNEYVEVNVPEKEEVLVSPKAERKAEEPPSSKERELTEIIVKQSKEILNLSEELRHLKEAYENLRTKASQGPEGANE